MHKASAFEAAAASDVILVCPDTSPRGAGIAGETDSWDFGAGAGFYVNATEEKVGQSRFAAQCRCLWLRMCAVEEELQHVRLRDQGTAGPGCQGAARDGAQIE